MAAWLQISGPTFAAMVFGFVLLWNRPNQREPAEVDALAEAAPFAELNGFFVEDAARRGPTSGGR